MRGHAVWVLSAQLLKFPRDESKWIMIVSQGRDRALVPMRLVLSFLAIAAMASTSPAQVARGSGVRGEKLAKRADSIKLNPKFFAGQSLFYQLDFRSRINGSTVGLIADPQALKELEISLSALIRLDVLNVAANQASSGARPAIRLRTTYTKVATTIGADVPDPQADNLRERLQKLEQQSVEFTMGANGKVTDVQGLENIFPEQIQAVHEWISQIGFAASLPQAGIRIGQKWDSDLPMSGAIPLAGLAWHEENTYMRNEPCHTEKTNQNKSQTDMPGEQCAVILSTLSLGNTAKTKDRTPEEFRKKQLRTAGVINGNGESLTYISLQTGLVVSVTQTSGQQMDITITSLTAGSSLRYAGRVFTQSQLSLADVPPSASRK